MIGVELEPGTFDDGYFSTTYAECYLVIDEQGYLGRYWLERETEHMEIVHFSCEHSVCLWDDDGYYLYCQLCGLDVT